MIDESIAKKKLTERQRTGHQRNISAAAKSISWQHKGMQIKIMPLKIKALWRRIGGGAALLRNLLAGVSSAHFAGKTRLSKITSDGVALLVSSALVTTSAVSWWQNVSVEGASKSTIAAT